MAVAQSRRRKPARRPLRRPRKVPRAPRSSRARRGRIMTFGFFYPTLRTDPVRPSGVCETATLDQGNDSEHRRRIRQQRASKLHEHTTRVSPERCRGSLLAHYRGRSGKQRTVAAKEHPHRPRLASRLIGQRDGEHQRQDVRPGLSKATRERSLRRRTGKSDRGSGAPGRSQAKQRREERKQTGRRRKIAYGKPVWSVTASR